MWLATNLLTVQNSLIDAGPYATVAAVSVAVFILSYLVRAIENYVRHLHRKPYLPYAQPRFIMTTLGYILVADGFVVNVAFEQRLPLHTGTITISAGLLLLIASLLLSLLPYVREIRRLRRDRDDDSPAE